MDDNANNIVSLINWSNLEDEFKKYVNDNNKYSVFRECIKIGKYDALKLLLSDNNYDIDVNKICSECEKSYLHHAASNNNAQIVQLLIDNGADVNCMDINQNSSPLHIAVEYNLFDNVKVLLKAGANVNAHGTGMEIGLPLCLAIRNDSIKIFHLLLQYGAEMDTTKNCANFPLQTAIEYKRDNMFTYLLMNGADVNYENWIGQTPLMLVIYYNNIMYLSKLLRYGANINKQSQFNNKITPLMYAIKRGNLKMIDYLIKHGANVTLLDGTNSNVMHLACRSESIDICQYLISTIGLYFLNKQNDYGNTPLHVAAKYDNTDCIKLLLESGANVNVKNIEQITPLTLAVQHHNFKTIQLFLLYGVDLHLDRHIFNKCTSIWYLYVIHVLHMAGINLRQLDLFQDNSYELREQFVCDEIKQYFHKMLFKPLTLKQLARISIRNHCNNLVRLVDTQNLPRFIKFYLLFHIVD